MKKFSDLKKGDILVRDSSDNVIMLYIVDDKTHDWTELTYIKIYNYGKTEIGDGIMFDMQTWVKNEFDDRFNNMPSNIDDNLKKKIISGIMGEIEWT